MSRSQMEAGGILMDENLSHIRVAAGFKEIAN